MKKLKPIVIRQERMEWMKIRGGLVRDAKHCEAMGVAVWLYLHFQDVADRQSGLAVVDLDRAAKELGKSRLTIQKWFRRLVETGYLVPLTQALKFAKKEDRKAGKAPFLRITRHENESLPGRPEWVLRWTKSGRPLPLVGRPFLVDGRPKEVDGRPILVDGRPKVVDLQYRARASEESLEALESERDSSVVCTETAESTGDATPTDPAPAAADQNPGQTQTDPPSDQTDASSNGHPKPEAEAPPPEPRATPGRNGQPERPPADLGGTPFKPDAAKSPAETDLPPELDHFAAWDYLTDVFAHPFDRKPQGLDKRIDQALAASTDREPLETACRRVKAEVRENPSKARWAVNDAVQQWAILAEAHAERAARSSKAQPAGPGAPSPDDFDSHSFYLAACDLHAQGQAWDRLTTAAQSAQPQQEVTQ